MHRVEPSAPSSGLTSRFVHQFETGLPISSNGRRRPHPESCTRSHTDVFARHADDERMPSWRTVWRERQNVAGSKIVEYLSARKISGGRRLRAERYPAGWSRQTVKPCHTAALYRFKGNVTRCGRLSRISHCHDVHRNVDGGRDTGRRRGSEAAAIVDAIGDRDHRTA